MPGQVARHCGRLARALLGILAATTLLIGTGIGTLAWRLSQGPLPIPFIAHRIEAAVNADNPGATLRIGNAAIAWEGFRLGIDHPLDLRLDGVSATNASGATLINVPRADVSLSIGGLLVGRLQPRAIALNDAHLRVVRAVDGSIALDLGDLTDDNAADPGDGAQGKATGAQAGASPLYALLGELSRPVQSDTSRVARVDRLSQLRRLLIRDASLVVVDRRLGATWRAPDLDVDLTRKPEGGVEGHASLTLSIGDQSARISATASLEAGGARTRLHADIGEITPAGIARAAPGLAALSVADVPVSLTMECALGPALGIEHARADVTVGKGRVIANGLPITLDGARLQVAGDPGMVAIDMPRLAVVGHEGAPPSVITAHGTIASPTTQPKAELTLALDQVSFADLPALWPPGAGGGGARGWLTENITDGMARNGRFHVVLGAPADFSDIDLLAASGTMEGDGLTVHWLRPVPPIEQARAILHIVDPDNLMIDVASARQHPSSSAGVLTLHGGRMRISGIMHPHQLALIDADIAGPVAEAIALLREKRLHLLDRHPIDLRDPRGAATAKLAVSLPLENSVQMEQIGIHAQARLDDVHLTAVAVGRDLDDGMLDLTADQDGLKMSGTASIGGFPAKLGMDMDFRSGPPTQVLQRITASGRADGRQLAAAGLNAGNVYSGTAVAQVTLTELRNGRGTLDVATDLRDVDVTVPVLEWRKPAGQPASGAMKLLMDHDHLIGADLLTLDGDGLSVRGHAVYGTQGSSLHIDRMALGATDAQGDVTFPPAGHPGVIAATITGQQLDLSARFSQHAKPPPVAPVRKTAPASASAEPAGTAWSVDARFERALMNRGQMLTGLSLHAENDGRMFRRVRLEGRTDAQSPFLFEIAPGSGGRLVQAHATNAGELLRAMDVVGGMRGGTLSVDAQFEDAAANRPLAGTARIADFRLTDAPAIGRVLQGMTLYGLVELAQGPGLGFSRLEAPFRLSDDVLTLQDGSRAFSPSLGVTAAGTVDLARESVDVTGTIVPAYFFNSLLGNVPLIGRLFSPEEGSGLFAANYSVRGQIDDPSVSVNPLSALTPGFLRGVFGIF